MTMLAADGVPGKLGVPAPWPPGADPVFPTRELLLRGMTGGFIFDISEF
jgi:hypothetical protein